MKKYEDGINEISDIQNNINGIKRDISYLQAALALQQNTALLVLK
jgi:hypothetical protein